ncbi:hypothetical protein Patl1_28786 [Pistacia atlantica]|uniref:Uncharacterized protein n=1 Tax=Pistacia atlantica TaxID=434234 RepID=A0ACC1BDV5_9ROSI|nr:hypothetical protein Patl1_28786 [Pistacia atlantica]
MEKRAKHFVLVHGACHGAWCWYKVSTLLKSEGHKVTMLDMAASGKHPKQDLTLAVLLARPHPMFKDVALPNEVVAVSKERYGSIDRVYIVCDQDNIMKEDLQRWMIEKYPTDEEMVISGSDHMPMVSKPKELFTCLQEIADKFT